MTKFFAPPSNTVVPTFSPTLDGSSYICKMIWNLSAQRYYMLCLDFDGNIIFFVPLVSSPAGLIISLLTWDSERQIVNGICSEPHNIPVGGICYRTIMDSFPLAYSGSYRILSTGQKTFCYDMESNPNTPDVDSATIAGSLNTFISMSAGYFQSVIIYRNGQFEVYP